VGYSFHRYGKPHKMKNTFQILVLLTILIVPGSCKKDNAPAVYTLYNTWEVKEFISLQSTNYQKIAANKTLITFDRSGTYQLKLDVNTCSSTFKSVVENVIDIGIPECTEACCDSEFSKKFEALLPSTTSYSISGKVLMLNVPHFGTIKLALVE
jgi:hypothetical protein